jgi:hypothetical protein
MDFIGCSPLSIDWSFRIETINAQGVKIQRKATPRIPTTLNNAVFRVLGVIDRDFSTYTLRVFDESGRIYWRVYRHISVPLADATGLEPVELAYEHSELKSALGYGYGYGYLISYGDACADMVGGDVYVYIKFPLSGNATKIAVIMGPGGIFRFISPPTPNAYGKQILAVAVMEGGGFIRAYASLDEET